MGQECLSDEWIGSLQSPIFALPNDKNTGFLSHSDQSESTAKLCPMLLGGQGVWPNGYLKREPM